MIALVEQKKREVIDLCRRYRVDQLDLFGSAATGCFSPRSSDLDFLVRFADRQPTGDYADRYLGLADSLEQLFQCRVDLVTEESIRNPFFRQEVETTRQRLYEQPREEVVV